MLKRFRDRVEAGQLLAKKLVDYAHHPDAIVIGLPRGGVPVAAEVATALQVPLDICIVRKLGVPDRQELAMGAIGSGGVCWLNEDIIRDLRISRHQIDLVMARELRELQRRDRAYRGDRPPLDVRDRVVILIDDGLATGATMRAAIQVLQQQQPAQLIVAVPIASLEVVRELEGEVNRVVYLLAPEPFYAIGYWYDNFDQTSDREVCELLDRVNNLSC
jgi:putative phosphoribosyl transferase